jgi:hypothetical protein
MFRSHMGASHREQYVFVLSDIIQSKEPSVVVATTIPTRKPLINDDEEFKDMLDVS